MTNPLAGLFTSEPAKPSTVTLYSGADYTGESCTLPVDERTYSLAATGLPKIASLKINWVKSPMQTGAPFLRLYTKRPTSLQGDYDDGTMATFTKDTTDTGTWADATHLKAMFATDLVGRLDNTGMGMVLGAERERPIYDTLP
ncbi:hypothetical protein [Kitasatospora sp. NPDC091207]|uniref:hypothetical protein n=1 Tax=Kitasatospora sp. NPDC091207 TaxID=3364083 RepID=UPI00380237F8